MVQIDVPMAFGVGSFFAETARRQLQFGRPEYYYRAFWKNNIFQIFFFSWIPVYFLLNYFGWETTHMWWHEDSVVAYSYYLPIFIVVFFLAANAGFFLGRWLIQKGRVIANRVVYLGITAYSLIWIFAQTGSTFRLGTYTEWKAGLSPLFYEDRTFLAMLILTLVVWAVALVAFAVNLWREGMHLDYPG